MTHSATPIPAHMLPQTKRLPVVAALAISFARLVVIWDARRRTRQHLSRLDDRMLNDIGVSRAEARTEAERPFWMT
ncbi:MAG: DUF1127 domain-containing protein [Paracoccaceae bacterium]